MLGELDDTQLNGGMIYVLAECPRCRTRYAVTPDPLNPAQWAFYLRDRADQRLSHLCSRGLLCVRGHELLITVMAAVLSQEGDWLNVALRDVQPVLN